MKKFTFLLILFCVFSISYINIVKANPYSVDIYHLFNHEYTTPENEQEEGDYHRVCASKQCIIIGTAENITSFKGEWLQSIMRMAE